MSGTGSEVWVCFGGPLGAAWYGAVRLEWPLEARRAGASGGEPLGASRVRNCL